MNTIYKYIYIYIGVDVWCRSRSSYKGEGLARFIFFQGLSFLDLEITLLFRKLCHAFEEKIFFSGWSD